MLLVSLALTGASACVSNVQKVKIDRLTALPSDKKLTVNGMAQGGQAAPVVSPNRKIAKTSIGGDFTQRPAASANFKLSGGFYYGR